MSSLRLPSIKAKPLLRALQNAGFIVLRTRGSHRFMRHPDGRTMVFSAHDRETIGPRLLSRIIKDAEISPEKLRTLI